MHISEKNELAPGAEGQKIVNLLIAGGARYEIARSLAGLIFVLNAHRFPVPSSNTSTRDTEKDIKSA